MNKVLFALFLVSVAICATLVYASDAPKHGLMTVDHAWIKAMLANDAAACANLYADDAVLVLPGTGAIKGKKAIAEAYAGWLAEVKVTEAVVIDPQYRSGGNVSAGWGSWKVTTEPKAGGAPPTQTGTFSAVAVRKNGVWKYISDHASADPAPAAK
jgi:uncharacterized protein (TIGR02246 family)